MDDHRSAEHDEDLPAPPRPPGPTRPPRLPDPAAVPGVPPLPSQLVGAVDLGRPFRRDEPRPAEPDADDDLDWSLPPPPPPVVGPLPAPPPPRPLAPTGRRASRGRRRARDPWQDGDPSVWQHAVAPDFPETAEPLAAPRRRRPPWKALVGALIVAVAVLGGLSVLDDDGGDAVVDSRPPAFAEQPAVDEQP